MARVSIEDCLTTIDNRFVLVAVASHRTRRLMSGADQLVSSTNKEAVTALREIAEGRVQPNVPPLEEQKQQEEAEPKPNIIATKADVDPTKANTTEANAVAAGE